jgi:hypothetical protein
MIFSKLLGFFSIFFFLLVSIFGFNVYNENGAFEVSVDTLNSEVFNNGIESDFSITVKNNLDTTQEIDFVVDSKGGWDISLSDENIKVEPNQKVTFNMNLKANSAFDYTPSVVSPNLIKISQNNEGYSGFFEFPVKIVGNDEVFLTYSVNIKPTKDNLKFVTKIQQTAVSPVSALKFTVNSEAVIRDVNVEISVSLDDYKFDVIEDIFTPDVNYKIYQLDIPSTIAPGDYTVRATTRVLNEDGQSAQEWFSTSKLVVAAYKNIDVVESRGKGLFRDRVEVTITNLGNEADLYSDELSFGFFKSLLFGTDAEMYTDLDNGVGFEISLEKGESKTFTYSFNYLALVIVVFVIITISSYVYVRKNSNPLIVKNQLFEVERVKHEGVKGFKVRIGFENIKEHELDKLKIIFRMPSYLQVKDESFSLTEPKHVLKGDSQYKLVWDFKRFEKGDTRLLGFNLVNQKGILGDIRLPDLELEVKVNGKTRKYYQSFPVIKG